MVRYAVDGELDMIGTLRWKWAVQENNTTAATSDEEFARTFASWAREHASTHRWIIATRGDAIIGMACLAIVSRVPTPQAPAAAS